MKGKSLEWRGGLRPDKVIADEAREMRRKHQRGWRKGGREVGRNLDRRAYLGGW